MATALLSQHSSNPLEVGSSDVRNRAYRRHLMCAQKMRSGDDKRASSDDPLNDVPELEQYHSHLAQLYPKTHLSYTTHDDINLAATADDSIVVLSDEEPPAQAPEGDDLVADGEGHQEDADEEEENGSEDGGDDGEREEENGEEPDAHAETDEEFTIHLKPREEQEEIEEEIADLETAVPQLASTYKIVDRLGNGTFSSVYKAIDLGYHSKWDNTPWHGHHPPPSSAHYQSVPRPWENKVFVAVKRIYVTSSPERMRNEILILEDCRGCRHVSQLITAFRHHDQVVVIMPYHRHQDFREFYRTLPVEGIKAYFRCMFRALRDIHARGIIHRDVKPANFLFDPVTGIGTLCDFGLACRMERGPTLGSCLHTPPTREHPHGRIRPREEYDVEQVKRMQREARLRCSWPSEKIGYPEKDTRPVSKANRAGTRGFRAPEVLFKCGEQTGAIDVWAAGMILLFFLTKRFPLLQSNDDMESLLEIASIVGKKRMEKAATLHSRMFQTNLPSVTQDGMTWREFVERQSPHLREPPPPDPRYYPYSLSQNQSAPPPSSSSPSRYSPSRSSSPAAPSMPLSQDVETYSADIDNALDFVEQIMQPESTRRMLPRRALVHPFLREPDAPDDDEFFPHPFGEGICGEWHFIDDEDELCIRVRVPDEAEMCVRRVQSGEGIAIGNRPCEFHREEDGYEYS